MLLPIQVIRKFHKRMSGLCRTAYDTARQRECRRVSYQHWRKKALSYAPPFVEIVFTTISLGCTVNKHQHLTVHLFTQLATPVR
jgi:hypothetical protein